MKRTSKNPPIQFSRHHLQHFVCCLHFSFSKSTKNRLPIKELFLPSTLPSFYLYQSVRGLYQRLKSLLTWSRYEDNIHSSCKKSDKLAIHLIKVKQEKENSRFYSTPWLVPRERRKYSILLSRAVYY